MRSFVSKFLPFGIALLFILFVSTLLAYQEPDSPSLSISETDHPYLITDASVNYIVINGGGFAPVNMTIETGESVTWHNATDMTHTFLIIVRVFIFSSSFNRYSQVYTIRPILPEMRDYF